MGCERGVERSSGARDPEAVRPDQPGPVTADEGEKLVLTFRSFAPDLRKAGRDDAECACPALERRLAPGDHQLARQADDGEVDRLRDLLDRRVALDAGDRLAVAVDRIGAALEATLEDVAEEIAPDRAVTRRRAQHGHAFRLEERP